MKKRFVLLFALLICLAWIAPSPLFRDWSEVGAQVGGVSAMDGIKRTQAPRVEQTEKPAPVEYIEQSGASAGSLDHGKRNEPVQYNYVLNTNTHKFHYPYCSSVSQMNEENKWYYSGTRDEVIAMGYEPCGRCKP